VIKKQQSNESWCLLLTSEIWKRWTTTTDDDGDQQRRQRWTQRTNDDDRQRRTMTSGKVCTQLLPWFSQLNPPPWFGWTKDASIWPSTASEGA
jgi:hypothetical protein